MSDEQATKRPARRRRRKPSDAQRPPGEAPAAAAAAPAQAPVPSAPPRQGRPEQRGGRGPMKGKPRRGGERNERPAVKLKSVEVMVDRGRDFVIVKRTEFDAASHRPLSVRYTLTRDGLPQPRGYSRLSEAREDSTKPLEELVPPEPPAAEPPAAEPEVAATALPDAPATEPDDRPPGEPGEVLPGSQ